MAGDASRRGVPGQQPLRNVRKDSPVGLLTVVEATVSSVKKRLHADGISMTGAHSIVNKLYPAAALPAPALAGHCTPEEDGDVIADLVQNILAQSPALPDDSECPGCVACRGAGRDWKPRPDPLSGRPFHV